VFVLYTFCTYGVPTIHAVGADVDVLKTHAPRFLIEDPYPRAERLSLEWATDERGWYARIDAAGYCWFRIVGVESVGG
jgi:hypothetical protein